MGKCGVSSRRLAGDPSSLADAKSVALTPETAERYFGDWRKAIGRTIMLQGRYSYIVTGVINTIPANTGFQLKVVVSYKTE